MLSHRTQTMRQKGKVEALKPDLADRLCIRRQIDQTSAPRTLSPITTSLSLTCPGFVPPTSTQRPEMSQPQVLKHSHTRFNKRSDPLLIDPSDSDSEAEGTRTRIGGGQNHVNAPDQPSDLPSDGKKKQQQQPQQQQQHASYTETDDESVSASALEEELERSEFDPFVDNGKHGRFIWIEMVLIIDATHRCFHGCVHRC